MQIFDHSTTLKLTCNLEGVTVARKSPRSRAYFRAIVHRSQTALFSRSAAKLGQYSALYSFDTKDVQLFFTLAISTWTDSDHKRCTYVSLCLIDLVQPVRIRRRSTRLFLSQLVSQFCCGDKSCTLQENKFLLLVHTRYRNQPNSLRKLNEENKLRAKRSLNKDQIPCTS